MACSKHGSAAGDVPGDGFHLDRQCCKHLVDDRHRLHPAASRADEDLGIGARRQDQALASHCGQGGDRPTVMRVLRIEETDHDAGVDDDHRHSRRSLFR